MPCSPVGGADDVGEVPRGPRKSRKIAAPGHPASDRIRFEIATGLWSYYLVRGNFEAAAAEAARLAQIAARGDDRMTVRDFGTTQLSRPAVSSALAAASATQASRPGEDIQSMQVVTLRAAGTTALWLGRFADCASESYGSAWKDSATALPIDRSPPIWGPRRSAWSHRNWPCDDRPRAPPSGTGNSPTRSCNILRERTTRSTIASRSRSRAGSSSSSGELAGAAADASEPGRARDAPSACGTAGPGYSLRRDRSSVPCG